jgi:hypothetical protein
MDILGRYTYMTKTSNRKELKCLGIHRVVVVAATVVRGDRDLGIRDPNGLQGDLVAVAVVAACRPIWMTFCARARTV